MRAQAKVVSTKEAVRSGTYATNLVWVWPLVSWLIMKWCGLRFFRRQLRLVERSWVQLVERNIRGKKKIINKGRERERRA